ncbi:MAG: TIGR03943 family protein [Anaerolineales bacterium]|nr:TIGR03943 family protein [Anaerolineales bacterium]
MKASLKALALIAMGLFLYSRIYNGTLLYYISERFAWLTLLAAIGFIIVGASYRYRTAPAHEHEHDDDGHEHHQHDHAGHQHGNLSWTGLLLVALPVILGLLVPPKPLGAAAMGNREISVGAVNSAAAPKTTQVISRPTTEKNVLDWLIDFRLVQDPAAFADQEAKLIGFVYRDERFGTEQFMVSRFVISCCAADAAPLGLVVAWPETPGLSSDQWVEVSGRLQPGEFDGEPMPILIADKVTPTEVPDQPYLYPY